MAQVTVPVTNGLQAQPILMLFEQPTPGGPEVPLNAVLVDGATVSKSNGVGLPITDTGTPASAAVMAPGGSGLTGWLTSIVQALLSWITDARPANAQALGLVTANTAFALPLAAGRATVAMKVVGLTGSGATLAIEASSDGGVTWDPKNADVPSSAGGVAQSIIADGPLRIGVAGLTNVRLRVVTVASGGGSTSVAINYSASSATGPIAIGSPLPPGTNTIGAVTIAGGASFQQAGSVGADYSSAKPALPNVGAAFGGAGPYAGYVLVATVPANPARANVDIENTSGGLIAVVRDDGTAGAGAAPANASVFALAAGAAVGQQGGGWSSNTFRGRLQVYAPSAPAQVAIFVD